MFKFEQTDYGLKLTVYGALGPSEVVLLKTELGLLIARQDGPWSGLVDACEQIPTGDEIAAVLEHCERMALKGGMQRMAILYKSPVVKGHVQQIGHLSGTLGVTIYVDASTSDNAEQVALDWLTLGIAPTENNTVNNSDY